mmetsp:Transcript_5457/g.8477  ORF Transcript_5457/g.8477 Transcript_5457/m.8477 type:complete len:166 (+) Transcript_5457:316-813(+)
MGLMEWIVTSPSAVAVLTKDSSACKPKRAPLSLKTGDPGDSRTRPFSTKNALLPFFTTSLKGCSLEVDDNNATRSPAVTLHRAKLRGTALSGAASQEHSVKSSDGQETKNRFGSKRTRTVAALRLLFAQPSNNANDCSAIDLLGMALFEHKMHGTSANVTRQPQV